jgi:hypothetical protein
MAQKWDLLTIDELRQRAWGVVAPKYQACIAIRVAQFEAASSKDLGSTDHNIEGHIALDADE